MDHDFYKLTEAAKLLGCESNDLLKWGATGEIELRIWFAGKLMKNATTEEVYRSWEKVGKEPLPWLPTYSLAMMLPIFDSDIMKIYIKGFPNEIAIDWLMWPRFRAPIIVDNPCKGVALDELFITAETLDTLKTKLNKNPPESAAPCINEEPAPPLTTQIPPGIILVGWKEIAHHLKRSESTAKRYAKGQPWPNPGPTGKPTTTTAELDKYLLTVSKKKKKRI